MSDMQIILACASMTNKIGSDPVNHLGTHKPKETHVGVICPLPYSEVSFIFISIK